MAFITFLVTYLRLRIKEWEDDTLTCPVRVVIWTILTVLYQMSVYLGIIWTMTVGLSEKMGFESWRSLSPFTHPSNK